MTVAELIAALSAFPPEMRVVTLDYDDMGSLPQKVEVTAATVGVEEHDMLDRSKDEAVVVLG